MNAPLDDLRPFAPLSAGNPMIGGECRACWRSFKIGDVPTLISLGPGLDKDERAKAHAGRAYNAVAIPVHWACATGSDDPVDDWRLYDEGLL